MHIATKKTVGSTYWKSAWPWWISTEYYLIPGPLQCPPLPSGCMSCSCSWRNCVSTPRQGRGAVLVVVVKLLFGSRRQKLTELEGKKLCLASKIGAKCLSCLEPSWVNASREPTPKQEDALPKFQGGRPGDSDGRGWSDSTTSLALELLW